MNETWILIVGNVFDGHEFYGPFADFEEAAEWADNNIDSEWLVAKLTGKEGTQ